MSQSKFIAHTCTGSPIKLSTILDGSSTRLYIGTIAVRAKHSNVGTVYWGGPATSLTDAGGYLEPGDAVAIDLTNKFFSSDDWYFNGTSNDIVYFTMIS